MWLACWWLFILKKKPLRTFHEVAVCVNNSNLPLKTSNNASFASQLFLFPVTQREEHARSSKKINHKYKRKTNPKKTKSFPVLCSKENDDNNDKRKKKISDLHQQTYKRNQAVSTVRPCSLKIFLKSLKHSQGWTDQPHYLQYFPMGWHSQVSHLPCGGRVTMWCCTLKSVCSRSLAQVFLLK